MDIKHRLMKQVFDVIPVMGDDEDAYNQYQKEESDKRLTVERDRLVRQREEAERKEREERERRERERRSRFATRPTKVPTPPPPIVEEPPPQPPVTTEERVLEVNSLRPPTHSKIYAKSRIKKSNKPLLSMRTYVKIHTRLHVPLQSQSLIFCDAIHR